MSNTQLAIDAVRLLDAELRAEAAVIDRIWGMFGPPSFAELKGRGLYDLIADLQKDAERYRYVRAKPHMLLHLSNKDFDAAIDAAIREVVK